MASPRLPAAPALSESAGTTMIACCDSVRFGSNGRKGSVALIEGFRVQNYRSLRDVALGGCRAIRTPTILAPLTVVIGKNGAGKSTLFDAFGFLADCLTIGVEAACDREQRGGFERLRPWASRSQSGSRCTIGRPRISDRSPMNWPSISTHPDARSSRPRYCCNADKGDATAGRFRSFAVARGIGQAWAGEDAVEIEGEESNERMPVALTDSAPTRHRHTRNLARSSAHHPISGFSEGLVSVLLHARRGARTAGRRPAAASERARRQSGQRRAIHAARTQGSFPLNSATVSPADTGHQEYRHPCHRGQTCSAAFQRCWLYRSVFAQQMSDGTLKVFAYLLLLEDPDPPPFICIEEPENGLYHKLLETLAREFRAHATGRRNAPQIFVTTHQPYFVDALSPKRSGYWKRAPTGSQPSAAPRTSKSSGTWSPRACRWAAFG